MTPYVAAENRGDVFVMPTWATGGFFVRNTRKAEFVCLERACAILRESNRLGDSEVFVDVGAHIGTSVIPALTRHGFARAIAIEPDPGNVRILRANLALNGLHADVSVVHAALSDSPGRLWFVPGRHKGGTAKGRLRNEPGSDAERVDVVTLDSLAEAGTVDPAATGLLWMGKGFKDAAFLTATLTFLKHRVPIVFVQPRDWMTGSSPLLHELKENGYEQVIDLRRPSLDEPLSEWPRLLEPIDNLPAISPRKTITDVLVF